VVVGAPQVSPIHKLCCQVHMLSVVIDLSRWLISLGLTVSGYKQPPSLMDPVLVRVGGTVTTALH
jgi:hypothetical protein